LRFGPFFQVFGDDPDTGVKQTDFGGKRFITGFVQVLMQSGNDQFFVVCNRLPQLVQLFNAEINVFSFAVIEKLSMFIKDFQYVCAV
jgi:choline kinase